MIASVTEKSLTDLAHNAKESALLQPETSLAVTRFLEVVSSIIAEEYAQTVRKNPKVFLASGVIQ